MSITANTDDCVLLFVLLLFLVVAVVFVLFVCFAKWRPEMNCYHSSLTNALRLNKKDLTYSLVPAGSPSHGGDVTVYVFDINQPSLPAIF